MRGSWHRWGGCQGGSGGCQCHSNPLSSLAVADIPAGILFPGSRKGSELRTTPRKPQNTFKGWGWGRGMGVFNLFPHCFHGVWVGRGLKSHLIPIFLRVFGGFAAVCHLGFVVPLTPVPDPPV